MQKLLLLTAMIVCINVINAQPLVQKIDNIVKNSYDEGLFNGCALVVDNGEIIYKKGYGYANFEWDIPNSTTTKFKIGSCTKQFTAALILLLSEEGKIDLNNDITAYIPDYPADKGNKITIHHLLSHTSGIPDYFYLPKMQDLFFRENKTDDFIHHFWNLDLEFDPGSKLKYSNSGYFLLGKIIENVTGKSYAQVLQEKILDPLKMNDTGVVNDKQIFPHKACGYVKLANDIEIAPYINTSGAYAAGAMYSTVEDLNKWQQALETGRILSKESFNRMLTPNFSRYGYGFGILQITVAEHKRVTLYGHEGEIYGFRSLIHIFRDEHKAIILLDNNQNTTLMNIATKIRKALYAD